MTLSPPAAGKGTKKLSKPATTTVTLHINGHERKLTIAPWTTLLAHLIRPALEFKLVGVAQGIELA